MVSFQTIFSGLALALPVCRATTYSTSHVTTLSTSHVTTSSKMCAADNCFASAALPPAFSPIASAFCEDLIHVSPGTVTKIATQTATSTIVPARNTITVSVTSTATVTTTPTLCLTTLTTSFPTSVFYPTRGSSAALTPRNNLPVIPSELADGCSESSILSKVSSACSCFLKATTKTATVTRTAFVTSTVQPLTATETYTAFTTLTSCTQYSTSYVYTGPMSCGIASPTIASTSGQVTCTSPAPAGQTNGRFRIEGGDEGTVFEDCISSGPEEVTTPSGGTHECDGTNGGANPNPGATCTTQLQNAAQLDGFAFDGTYDDQFQDFFITSIDKTTQTSTQFWGLLQDLAFTPVGGCQAEIAPGGKQETLWAFDAFNANAFLSIAPEYAVVSSGTKTVQITVTASDGSGNTSPYAGATVEGSTGPSDSSGKVTINVPSVPGCYQYKATASAAIRSNAFYLTVLGSN